MSGWTGQYHGKALVGKHRMPSRIQAQDGARGLRRDALEIASSEPLNTSEQVQGNTYTRRTRQSHRCLDESDYKRQYKAYKAYMAKPQMSGWPGQYHGKALWSTVRHGWETVDAPRRRQRPGQRCSRNSICRTAKYKWTSTRQYIFKADTAKP